MTARTPENLRAAALHIRKMVREIVDEDARRTLTELAAELDARAAAAESAASGRDAGTA
jgi:hypothetical protein